MWRDYPYLQDPYTITNLNEESNKRKILAQIDDFINQRQYVRMTLLDWQENPLKSIEGEISSGSMSKDGASAVRCTCSLNCSVDGNSYNVDDMDMDFTLNRKIFIEVGIKNETNAYPEFPILWFPQGVFFITNFSMNSSSSSSVNLAINLKDKMAMLNGELGGTFPSTIRLDAMDTQLPSGEFVEQKILIYNLIIELVNHWGNEDLNNIIIEDIPLRVRKLMRWEGNNPIYSYYNDSDQKTYTFTLDKPENVDYITYEAGTDLGYVFSDFVLPDEVYANGGDTVVSVLDQIKNRLGNYEYFYDEFGLFHFREIKNYINSSQAQNVLDDMDEKQYLIETTNEKSIYSFSSDKNIISISVSPKYDNIKNDYIVHGLDKGSNNNAATMIMYHLVIDEKPEIAGYYTLNNKTKPYYGNYFENIFFYTDPDDMLNKLGIYTKSVNTLPDINTSGIFYHLNEPNGNGTVWYWNGLGWKQAYILTKDIDGNIVNEDVKFPKNNKYYPEDYRTFFYLSGLYAQKNGTETNRYFQELNAFWPAEYNLDPDNQGFYEKQFSVETGSNSYVNLSLGKYYLDFIGEESDVGQYSISAIGCRSDVVTDENINCLFSPYIPDIIFINVDNPDINLSENTTLTDDVSLIERYYELYPDKNTIPKLSDNETTNWKQLKLAIARKECQNMGYAYTQVKSDIYDKLVVGGLKNPAFDTIQMELFYHTNYQKTVSLTTLPIYYLKPNSRVTLNDKSTNTYGDYMIQNLNFSFGPGANMTISLNEVHERI